MKINISPSPIQQVRDELLDSKGIRLYIKRDDLLHAQISGNKIRKLYHNLIKARKDRCKTILTFGGAYSNHIYAVAAAGHLYGFKTIGIIRGEPYDPMNPTLAFAVSRGMQLHYLSRQEYRDKYSSSVIKELRKRYGNFYLLPEGGTNELAVSGCTEIVREIKRPFDIITCCCGTGGTFAGIIAGLQGEKYAIGFPVLKNAGFLSQEIKDLITKYNGEAYTNWHLELNYHFGGYARFDASLIHFINLFKQKHKISLDPVYTGKMMFGIFKLIRNDRIAEGTRIIAIHTGGLQGISGFNERFGGLIQ